MEMIISINAKEAFEETLMAASEELKSLLMKVTKEPLDEGERGE